MLKRLLLVFFAVAALFNQQAVAQQRPAFLNYLKDAWVDSTLNALSPQQRIAQLMMVAGYSHKGLSHQKELEVLVSKYGVGGIIFFKGGPMQQAQMTNFLQSKAQVPLLLSIDAEWGLAMRLDSTIQYPYEMALGAIQDDSLIFKMGEAIAKECQALGMHVNFAPVADVNNNPKNPVISFRSFGENRELVAQKAIAYLQGMQSQGLLANAKHFPGHGDTDIDSHKDLPLITHDRARLDSIELYPFRELIKAGAASMMVAHMSIPALDATPNLPTTLSKPVVTDLLQTELGFDGLIFTDALNMKGVAKYFPPGKVDVKAILAGNDVLLFTEDVPKAIAAIEKAIAAGELSQEEIDRRCRKILAAKRWVNLHEYQPIDLNNLYGKLNEPKHLLLLRQLTAASLTVLKNESETIPVKNLEMTKIASVSIGVDDTTVFQQTLSKYAKIKHFTLPKEATASQINAVKKQLAAYDLVIVGLHQMRKVPYNYVVYDEAMKVFISELASNEKSILAVFRNPYTLSGIDWIEKSKGLAIAYQDTPIAQSLMAQLLFGGIGGTGRLPVSIGKKFAMGSGIDTQGGLRMQYTLPEGLGIDSKRLHERLDSIAHLALNNGVAPGLQIFASKDGQVFFHKAYGYHTYDSLREVQIDDLYDLASITKIAGATLALMKLQDEGIIDVEKPISDYYPYWQKGNKKKLHFKEVLSHQARLKAWFPYWEKVVKRKGRYKEKYVHKSSSPEGDFNMQLADSLYLNKYFKLRIQRKIRKSWFLWKDEMVYSGLSFYVYPDMVERLTGFPFDDYLANTFYEPMGAHNLVFNPWKEYPLARVIPTEVDTFFRQRLIHNYVHDEGAIMMGGVSGNAGLFGTADDLAKVMQLFLNKGSYGGQQFFSPETMAIFNQRYYAHLGNHRGLGFDKPLLANKPNGTPSPDASEESFGHSGYTGTFTWADPENGLLFIFLSNRVHPTRYNPKIYRFNIRPAIHQALYDAL